jgi:hypothetical protein
MRNNQQPQEDPIALDDLFQLKRQEKPDPEFWEEFDEQLQQKMLGSMVDRRSTPARAWQFAVRKLLPLSLAGSAVAALVVSIAPGWQTKAPDVVVPDVAAEVAAAVAPVTAEVDSVDFHEAELAATPDTVENFPEFTALELSVDTSVNAVYETNGLVASSESLQIGIAEQLF